MSAEFDDLVARVKALALDELMMERGAAGEATYPLESEIEAAQDRLLTRIRGTLRHERTLPYHVRLPGGAIYHATPVSVGDALGVAHAIAAMSRPHRANEL